MDYSKLSDFEINKLIENIVRPGWQESDYRVPNSYCNNPADAWPIIVENKISLNHYSGTWEASWEYDAPVGAFGTDEEVTGTIGDSNPLRAAMLVYLQLQEGK